MCKQLPVQSSSAHKPSLLCPSPNTVSTLVAQKYADRMLVTCRIGAALCQWHWASIQVNSDNRSGRLKPFFGRSSRIPTPQERRGASFQGLPTQDTREVLKVAATATSGRHGPYLTARYPLCSGADVLDGCRVLAGVNYPERSEEHARPGAVDSLGPPGSPPVERAGRKEPREPAVQPGLAPVTRAAQPVEVLQCEGAPERVCSYRPGDVDRKPVVDLRGSPSAALAHRHLDADRLLSGCDTVGRQAVVVPYEMYGGGVLVAPATDTASAGVFPLCRAGHEPAGMSGELVATAYDLVRMSRLIPERESEVTVFG